MIYSIKGTVLKLQQHDSFFVVALESGSGIGFSLKVSGFTAKKCEKIGETVCLFTHLVVRENAFDLFGFFTESERSVFQLLISVSGVGPSFAISVLNKIEHTNLIGLIASGNEAALCCCKGVGKKTASRIVLELQSKIEQLEFDGIKASVQNSELKAFENENFEEAVKALVVLGYEKSVAQKAVASQLENCSVEQLIKNALKVLV